MWPRRFLIAIWTAVRGDRDKFDEKFPQKFGDSKNLSYLCTRKLRNGGLAQLARALAWHARGHRFDSDILHPDRETLLSLSYLL